MTQKTVVQALASEFAAHNVRHIFGVPGGGSSLDIIQTAAELDIEFILTRTESAAVTMAAVTAELNGTLGVALTTKGPGTASAANGVAYASLDRSPVLVLTDGFSTNEQNYVTHQVFDQRDLLAPVTKGHSRLDGDAPVQQLKTLIKLAMTPPFGPVHIELTGEQARASLTSKIDDVSASQPDGTLDEDALDRAEQLLKKSQRPVVIVGLEARESGAAAAVQALVEALNCPVLTTYKAKGVISNFNNHYVGIFTCGSAEVECIEQADLIILCGLDPVELLRQPWRYDSPVIDIALVQHPIHYVTAEVGVYGSLDAHISKLSINEYKKDWSISEIGKLRNKMRARLECPSTGGIGPQQVVELAVKESRILTTLPRITVDAGAHMFSVMAFWPCCEPCDALISNGLSTMAFALPAAIAAALHEPDRAVIAFTGDGGLLMCLGELSVAAEQEARIVVIVFNDKSLSLIDIKQQQRGLLARGVRWKRPDFAKTMEGLGGRGYHVETLQDYRIALAEALRGAGPALIDVSVDPSGYPAQMNALRG